MTATPPETRPLRGLGSALGIVISVVCLAAVVWWALQQDPPELPHTAREIAALVPLVVFIVWIGLHPDFFLSRMRPALQPLAREAAEVLARTPSSSVRPTAYSLQPSALPHVE